MDGVMYSKCLLKEIHYCNPGSSTSPGGSWIADTLHLNHEKSKIRMADREKRPQELNSHHNASNLGLSQTRAPDKRRKEVVDIGTGVEAEDGRLHGKTKEYSAWDVYNNEAKKVGYRLGE
jgi:hypothetical protein